mmetsp:Transcript_9933/g.10037  ORF Transcript_9933/g.10037 Transcript_9933/m.10037 type:complete len:251 (-) Transcript_9933:57-809(-)
MRNKFSTKPSKPMSTRNRSFLWFFAGCVFGFIATYILYDSSLFHPSGIAIPFDTFPEPAWRKPNTLSVRTVASTPFARFEIHKVKTESGEIVNDWLWTDERSHVNILVHVKEDDKYLLFQQSKYGLDKPKYAVVGGLFNKGEGPVECAQRELLEETGLVAEQMVNLGKYRVQVNRGGGYLYTYFAKNCFPAGEKRRSDDYEKQTMKKLTRKELIRITLAGEIGEAQWVAAVALGLLHEEHMEHHINHIGE